MSDGTSQGKRHPVSFTPDQYELILEAYNQQVERCFRWKGEKKDTIGSFVISKLFFDGSKSEKAELEDSGSKLAHVEHELRRCQQQLAELHGRLQWWHNVAAACAPALLATCQPLPELTVPPTPPPKQLPSMSPPTQLPPPAPPKQLPSPPSPPTHPTSEELLMRAADEQRTVAAERRAVAADERAAAAEERAAAAERRVAVAEQLTAEAMQRKEGLRSAAWRVVLWEGRVLASGPAPEHGAAERAARALCAKRRAEDCAEELSTTVAKAKRLQRSAPGGKSVMWGRRRAEAYAEAAEEAAEAWAQFPAE